MPIHEVSLIRPENLQTHEQLVVDGVDVSGHWSTFIQSRAITDYNEAMQDEIAALPGGENVHRCWQCGSCTNSCTVNAINPEFNPRYWIYLIRLGMESEILPAVADRDGEAHAAPPAGHHAHPARARHGGGAEHQRLVARPGGDRRVCARTGTPAAARARARRPDRDGAA